MAIEIDEGQQLRNLGIGLVLGGIVLAALSFVAGPVTAGSVLVVSGALVWLLEYRSELTVGIGVGIGVLGLLVYVESSLGLDLSLRELAIFAVVGGVLDYLLAPVYTNIRESGERTTDR